VAAAAAATTTATAAARGAARRRAGAGRGKDGELNGGLFAGTLGAGDFLLLVDDDFFEAFVAGIANVFVDGHGDEDLSRKCRAVPANSDYTAGRSGFARQGRRTRHAKGGFGALAQHRCLRTASEGGLTTLPKEGAGEEASGYANGLA